MIDPAHTALLVMDYQTGILGRLGGADALLGRAAGAIAVMREHGGQIGYVRVAMTDADYGAIPPASRMAATVAAYGTGIRDDSPATAIHERVAPAAGDLVVRKTRIGAFSTTDLDSRLRARGVDTLVLAGISTSGVLLSTVRDASDRDYRLVVLADASADPDPEVHGFLMTRIFPRQAEVIPVADLPGLLSGG